MTTSKIPQPYQVLKNKVDWLKLRKLSLERWSKMLNRQIICSVHWEEFDGVDEPCWACYRECSLC